MYIIRESLVNFAKKYIGYTSINNANIFNDYYYGHEVLGRLFPWCGTFICYCLAHIGVQLHYASPKRILRLAQDNNYLTQSPKIGDIFISVLNDTYYHTGIIIEVSDTSFISIEGNILLDLHISKVDTIPHSLNDNKRYYFIDMDSLPHIKKDVIKNCH